MTDPNIESLRAEQALLRARLDSLAAQIEALATVRKPIESPAVEAKQPFSTPLEHSLRPEPASSLWVAENAVTPPPDLPPVRKSIPQLPPLPEPPRSFEMQIGQVWLVRIGIGMLLTGLIFLASFAYQRFIEYINPFTRDLAFFVFSLALCGLGLWLEKSRETLRYFGRVLAAGGLAGGYYALFGAHDVPALKWIDDEWVANLLLMSWAAVIIGVACWRQAQTLGVAAIVLAYYTSLHGPDLGYTLNSNLILAVASLFLTLRYGWKFVSYASLLGTFGTYTASRIIPWAPAASPEATILAGYWVVFTINVLWPRVQCWQREERLSLLTLNNALFFILGAVSMTGPFDQNFPRFAMLFGALLIGLSFLSIRLRPEETAQETAFLIQGILALTAGWLSRWPGPNFALFLGFEGAILLSAATWKHGGALRFLSYLLAAGAFQAAGYDCLHDRGGMGASPPLLLALLFLGQFWWLRRTAGEKSAGAIYFGTLATLLYLVWVGKRVPADDQFWVLAVSGSVVYSKQFFQPDRFVNYLVSLFWALAAFPFAFVNDSADRIAWYNGLTLIGLFLLERLAIRWVPPVFLPLSGQILWLSSVFLGFWVYSGELIQALQPNWSQTLLWAVLSAIFFAVGVVVRERIARWWGLGTLAVSLGRVLLVDIWQWDTLSQIITFIGIGLILLSLGFFYNRYQEAIKKWL